MRHLTELRLIESRASGVANLRLVEPQVTPETFLAALREKLCQIAEYQMELARRRAAPDVPLAVIDKADLLAEAEACALEDLFDLLARRGRVPDPPPMLAIETLYASIAVVEATIVAGVMTSEIIRRGGELLRAIPASSVRLI